jgi:long-chain fatty acid transport protein
VGVNSPFGLVTKYDNDSILHQTGIAGTSEIFTLNVNPAVSVEVTDWLAVATGAQIQYFDGRLTRQALGPLGISSLDGDGIGLGFTAGIRIAPVPGTEIGLGYRSFIDHEVDGTLETTNAGDFHVHADGLNLPDIVTLGIRQSITDRFPRLGGSRVVELEPMAHLGGQGRSCADRTTIRLRRQLELLARRRVRHTQRAAVRAGIGYELSPIGDNVRSYRVPYNDGILLSVGASYRLDDRFSLDLGYGFVTVEDMDILAADEGGPDANGPFSGRADTHLHYLSAVIRVKM